MRSALFFAVALSSSTVLADGLPPLSLDRRPHAGEPRMDANGDVADLPEKKPEAVWLPLDLTSGLRARFHVTVNGLDLVAVFDTGADITLLSASAAHRLKLDGNDRAHNIHKSFDVNHKMIETYRTTLGSVALGALHIDGLQADVMPELGDIDLLIGYETLYVTDLLFAVDEGLLGVFHAQQGSLTPRDQVIRIHVADRALITAPLDESGRITETLLIDTGAPHSTFEATVADPANVPIDTRFARPIRGLDGTGKMSRGAYVFPHLLLGRERIDVGYVLADQSYSALLGDDVLMRHRTLLSSKNAELRFAPMPIRPAVRSKGPDGKPCADGPCASVAVAQHDGATCLAFSVDKAWAGKRVLGLVDVLKDDGSSAVAGGFMVLRVDVPAVGFSGCADPFGALAFFGVKPGSPTSLLRFHVIDPAEDQCKRDTCVTFTGILPPPAAHTMPVPTPAPPEPLAPAP